MSEQRRIKVWSLTHHADYEGGVTVFGSEEDMLNAVESDVREAADNNDIGLPEDKTGHRLGAWLIAEGLVEDGVTDAESAMISFIHEHGWKITTYDVETHTLAVRL